MGKTVNTYNKHYAFILGFYLGDGHIVKSGRSYRLSIYNDKRYETMNQQIEESLQFIFPDNKISRYNKQGCWKISVHSNNILEIFPQHGKGRKHGREIKLEEWQIDIVKTYPEDFLRGLFHSDGCIVYTKYGYKRYEFSNKSVDIHNILKAACSYVNVDRVNLRRKSNDKNSIYYDKWITSIGHRDCVEILSKFIPDKS